MANSLGNASLVVGANGDQLKKDLTKSEGDVKGWAGRVGSLMSSAFKFTGIGAIASTIFEAIKSPFDKLEELGKTQKQADVLGIDASELQGFQKLFAKVGVEADQVGRVFAIMGKNIQAGLGKTGGVIEDVDGELHELSGKGKAEAFQKLGLSLNELASQDYAVQFKMIAERIKAIGPGSEQAAAAMAIFGKSGAQLLPMLQRGGYGIDEFISKLKKTGAVLSDDQIAAAARAAKAWKEAKENISYAWQGLVNRSTLVAAPIVELVARLMTSGFERLTPVFDKVGRAVTAVAETLDYIFGQFGKYLDNIITLTGKWIEETFAVGAAFVTVEEVAVGALLAIGRVGATVFEALRLFASVLATAWGGVGMTMAHLGKHTGALTEDEAGLMWEKNRAVMDHAEELFKQFKSGAAFKFVDNLFDAAAMMNKLKRNKDKKGDDNNKPEDSKYTHAGALIEGTKEEYKARVEWETKNLGLQQDQKKVDEQQLDVMKNIADLIRRIMDKGEDVIELKAA